MSALRNASWCGLLCMAAVVGSQPAAGQQPVAVRPEPQAAAVAVRKAPDGSYVFSYGPELSKKELTITPASLTEPSADSLVDYDPDARTFHYSYVIRNGASAKQEIQSVTVSVIGPKAANMETPVGWEGGAIPPIGRVMWFRKNQEGRLVGIPAGGEQRDLRLVSPHLPGPSQAKITGNVPMPTVSNVPPEVRAKVMDVLTRNFVVADVLSPTIPSGAGEPELTTGVFLARISNAYESALLRSRHPKAREIVAVMKDAIERVDAADGPRRREYLNRIVQAATTDVPDPWAATLAGGLRKCIGYLDTQFPQRQP